MVMRDLRSSERLHRRAAAVVRRYAAVSDDGRLSRCTVQHGHGVTVKVIYSNILAAQRAADELGAIPGLMPQFVYPCHGHFHHTSRVDDTRRSTAGQVVVPPKVLKSEDEQRRYRRKCGVAACLLDLAESTAGFDQLIEALEWPLGRTRHGHDGRRVLRDLLDLFAQRGWIAQAGGTVTVVDRAALRALAESVRQLEG